jgi:hypothetical protein
MDRAELLFLYGNYILETIRQPNHRWLGTLPEEKYVGLVEGLVDLTVTLILNEIDTLEAERRAALDTEKEVPPIVRMTANDTALWLWRRQRDEQSASEQKVRKR